MAALLHDQRPIATDPVARFFALVPPATVGCPDEDPTDRPALRVIPGGREAALRHRQPAIVYRRRRIVVAAALALAIVLAAVGSGVVGASTAPSSPAPTALDEPFAPASVEASLPASYVVQPGDTLWSIAERLAPGTDVRPLVDELAGRAGPGPLQAGQRLDLHDLVA